MREVAGITCPKCRRELTLPPFLQGRNVQIEGGDFICVCGHAIPQGVLATWQGRLKQLDPKPGNAEVIYRTIERAFQLLTAPEATESDYQNLSRVLSHAQKEPRDRDKIAAQVAKSSPRFQEIAKFVAAHEETVYSLVLAVFIEVIKHFLASRSRKSPTLSTLSSEEKDDIAKRVAEHLKVATTNSARPPQRPSAELRAGPRQGRNERCGCGSGKKFKNCCGGPSQRR